MSNVTETQKRMGHADDSKYKDSLGVDSYYEGFKTFIECCDTPLTMAIQGKWGSGKTTALKLIEQKIEPKVLDEESGTPTPESVDAAIKNFQDKTSKCHVIWFNTWQYASFGLENNLMLALLIHLNDELKKITKENPLENVKKIFRYVKEEGTKTVPKAWAEKFSVTTIYDFLERTANKLDSLDTIQFDTEIITKLKQEIHKTILEGLDKDQRLVIFVDDLDRLDPKVAVDLLEGIKCFLDCPRCVFILAIDSEVVYKGVSSKYGTSKEDPKNKMFFDKIIQVPFDIPIHRYNTKKYIVNEFLKEKGIDPTYYDKYVKAVQTLIKQNELDNENNPRTIKRIFNLWELHQCMEQVDNQANLYNLFVLLALKNKNKDSYQKLVEWVEVETPQMIFDRLFPETGMADEHSQEVLDELPPETKKDIEFSQLAELLEKPCDISYKEANRHIDEAFETNREIEAKWFQICDQWNVFLSLLININPMQAANFDMNKFDFSENIKELIRELIDADNYMFIPGGKYSCKFEKNNKELLQIYKNGTTRTNITIYNMDNAPDFESRYNDNDTLKGYKFHVGHSKEQLTITIAEGQEPIENPGSGTNKKYSTDKLKAFLTAYGISFEI